jgi:hypothetical protein
MRDEYDFSKAVKGGHAERYASGTEVVVDGERVEPTLVAIEPDVSAVFPDAQSVNEALRLLIKAAKTAKELQKAS